jgi:hypothetical protein
MHITKLQVKNYKSFNSSNEPHFELSFNIILGQNITLKHRQVRLTRQSQLSEKS